MPVYNKAARGQVSQYDDEEGDAVTRFAQRPSALTAAIRQKPEPNMRGAVRPRNMSVDDEAYTVLMERPSSFPRPTPAVSNLPPEPMRSSAVRPAAPRMDPRVDPRRSSEAPRRSSEAPRRSSEAPRRSSEAPRRSSEAPRRSSEAPRRSSEAPRAIEAPPPFEAPPRAVTSRPPPVPQMHMQAQSAPPPPQVEPSGATTMATQRRARPRRVKRWQMIVTAAVLGAGATVGAVAMSMVSHRAPAIAAERTTSAIAPAAPGMASMSKAPTPSNADTPATCTGTAAVPTPSPEKQEPTAAAPTHRHRHRAAVDPVTGVAAPVVATRGASIAAAVAAADGGIDSYADDDMAAAADALSKAQLETTIP